MKINPANISFGGLKEDFHIKGHHCHGDISEPNYNIDRLNEENPEDLKTAENAINEIRKAFLNDRDSDGDVLTVNIDTYDKKDVSNKATIYINYLQRQDIMEGGMPRNKYSIKELGHCPLKESNKLINLVKPFLTGRNLKDPFSGLKKTNNYEFVSQYKPGNLSDNVSAPEIASAKKVFEQSRESFLRSNAAKKGDKLVIYVKPDLSVFARYHNKFEDYFVRTKDIKLNQVKEIAEFTDDVINNSMIKDPFREIEDEKGFTFNRHYLQNDMSQMDAGLLEKSEYTINNMKKTFLKNKKQKDDTLDITIKKQYKSDPVIIINHNKYVDAAKLKDAERLLKIMKIRLQESTPAEDINLSQLPKPANNDPFHSLY